MLEGKQREGLAVVLRTTPEMQVSKHRDTKGSATDILLGSGNVAKFKTEMSSQTFLRH